VSAIAQLKAMVGLDASAYKAGAQTVVGENARMTGSMRGAAGSIGQSSQVIKKNVMEVARASQGARSAFIGVSQAMSGNFAGAAASAATAMQGLGAKLLMNPITAIVTGIGLAVVAMGKEFERVATAALENSKKVAEGWNKARASIRAAYGRTPEARAKAEAEGVESADIASGMGGGLARGAAARAADAREFARLELQNATSEELGDPKRIAEKQSAFDRAEMQFKAMSAVADRLAKKRADDDRKAREEAIANAEKTAREIEELDARRAGKEQELYERRARQARQDMELFGSSQPESRAERLRLESEAIKNEMAADAERDRKSRELESAVRPRQSEIERLREEGRGLSSRERGISLDRGSLAKKGGFFGGERAGFEIQTKAIRVAEESKKVLDRIERLQAEILEVQRANRGER